MAADTKSKVKISVLELVYPPISNQEAIWLQSDPEVEALLRQSDFYMIAGRAEAKYTDFCNDAVAKTISFGVKVGDNAADSVTLHFLDLPTVAAHPGGNYQIELGEKLIRIWDGEVGRSTCVDWFTTEKLICERGRGNPGIEGFVRYREAATYDLLYVGIAKVGDTFDRLIKRGHKARMDILANEPLRYPGARVTDETYLFMFRVMPLIVSTFDAEHEFKEEDLEPTYDAKRISADAEKAFVSLLKPEYNIVKFSNYPKGSDGLYGSDYLRYGYAIGENICFNTMHGRFRGGRHPKTGFISNDGDAILVQGDTVTLLVSGVDFPADTPST